jgi:hypothetical protein
MGDALRQWCQIVTKGMLKQVDAPICVSVDVARRLQNSAAEVRLAALTSVPAEHSGVLFNWAFGRTDATGPGQDAPMSAEFIAAS